MFGLSKPDRIDAFWRAFLESEAELARSIAEKDAGRGQGLMLDLHRILVKVHPSLGFEFGAEAGGPLDFCITPDGDVAAFETARELVAAAPKVSGWNIHSFRRRKDLANVTIAVGDVAAEAKDVRYLANFGSKLDIVLLYDMAEDMDPELLSTIGVLLLDAALGEFDAATGIESLDVVNGRHPKSSPFLELPAAFDAWRAKVAN